MNNTKIYISNHLPNPPEIYSVKENKDIFTYITYPSSEIEGYNNMNIDLKKDNIFNLNIFFTEFAQIYYAWKNDNLTDINYIGHFHYRRIFHDFIYHNIDNIFKNYDIIVKHPDNEIYITEYNFEHVYKHIMPNIEDILRKYINIEDLYKTKYLYNCTVFIMKKEDFIDYCEWIFPIIIDIAKELCIYNNEISNKKWEDNMELSNSLYDNYIKLKKDTTDWGEDCWLEASGCNYVIPRFGGCIGEILTNYFISTKYDTNKIYYKDCWFV